MERLQEHDNRAQKTHEKKDGRTMLRRSKTPIMQPPVDIEKKSYHSHYIPPGVLGGHQFDPAAFRSDREAGPYQGPPPQPVPPQLYPPQGLQYIAVPVNYAVQAPQKKSQASLILGIVIISVLALLFIGLVVTIIVLAL